MLCSGRNLLFRGVKSIGLSPLAMPISHSNMHSFSEGNYLETASSLQMALAMAVAAIRAATRSAVSEADAVSVWPEGSDCAEDGVRPCCAWICRAFQDSRCHVDRTLFLLIG